MNSEKSYLQIPSISKEHLEFLVLSSTDDFCFGSTYGQKFDKNENPFAKKKMKWNEMNFFYFEKKKKNQMQKPLLDLK